MRDDWTDLENDAVVADYMTMLSLDLEGRPYNKAEHNRALQALIGRGRGSIEFKHQNVSAVLLAIGEPWIPGYKPAHNYQSSLVDAVARWLDRRPTWNAVAEASPGELSLPPSKSLQFGPPPDPQEGTISKDVEQIARVARRFDPAERDRRNRSLGKAGEELVFHTERARLKAAGREDLARKVRWISEEDGDGLGYDVLSFDEKGAERLLEVKTTNGWARTPFHLSRNELSVAEERAHDWHLFRVWNFAREPRAFSIQPPLNDHVELMPTSFVAFML